VPVEATAVPGAFRDAKFSYVVGSNSYEETAGSEVVVITAGQPRSPGMSRDDLVTTNEKIVSDVTAKPSKACARASASSSWPIEAHTSVVTT
jgi:malate/lactate dehydrogenase